MLDANVKCYTSFTCFSLNFQRVERMEKTMNQTSVMSFRLRGLSVNPKVQMAVFFMFLTFYVLTLIGNILIVITIIYDRRLHTPMYFFLSNLSFIDVCHSTVTVPKMLRDTFSEEKLIPFDACVVQMFFLHLFACTEIFLLTVMAYDRYVAICKPLQYMTIMNWKVCMLLAGALWTGGPSTLSLSPHSPSICPTVVLMRLTTSSVMYLRWSNWLALIPTSLRFS